MEGDLYQVLNRLSRPLMTVPIWEVITSARTYLFQEVRSCLRTRKGWVTLEGVARLTVLAHREDQGTLGAREVRMIPGDMENLVYPTRPAGEEEQGVPEGQEVQEVLGGREDRSPLTI